MRNKEGKYILCQCCKKRIYRKPYNLKHQKYFFCSRKCKYAKAGLWLTGEKHPSWKGGKTKTTDGYIWIYNPSHPNSNKQGYILEHRFVMSKALRRPLKRSELVHHLNGIRIDNRIKNLFITDESNHCKIHLPHGPNRGLRKFNNSYKINKLIAINPSVSY